MPLITVLLCLTQNAKAQVGINTTNPSSAAVLDLNSNFGGTSFGGLMPPRVTIAQRNSIPVTAADDGLMAYVSGFAGGERCLQLFNGATMTWENITCFGVPAPPQIAFFESMGNVATNTTITTHHTNLGFDNSSTSTFSSTSSTQSQIRNTLPSNANVSTASGGGNVYFSNGNRDFVISNINLLSFTGNLTLELLIYKSTNVSNGSELTIEYFNGTAWINVSVNDLPTGTGTAIWYQRTLATNVPNTIQQIRISRATVANATEFRIDDIKITSP